MERGVEARILVGTSVVAHLRVALIQEVVEPQPARWPSTEVAPGASLASFLSPPRSHQARNNKQVVRAQRAFELDPTKLLCSHLSEGQQASPRGAATPAGHQATKILAISGDHSRANRWRGANESASSSLVAPGSKSSLDEASAPW